MKLTPEDFEAWRTSPLTRLVLDRFLGEQMGLTRGTHQELGWEGLLDPERHAALRERYETLEWIQGLSFEELSEWLTTAQEAR